MKFVPPLTSPTTFHPKKRHKSVKKINGVKRPKNLIYNKKELLFIKIISRNGKEEERKLKLKLNLYNKEESKENAIRNGTRRYTDGK
mmetsp:Transcript_43930/g.44609  ORF Transcript_43930/g.44609 Transcript_43930/m.44609 type:complete len:87 (+) Transcript_43930:1503-1763(+)